MAYTDPLTARNRRLAKDKASPQRKGQLTTYKPVQYVQPKANDEQAFLASIDTGVTSRAPKQESSGFLGSLLNNPVGKAVTDVLGVLDVPRRAVISGLHELADFSGELAGGGGDGASWDDFMSQTKDPNFGVGQFVDSGNKWVDRLAGFAGDVALDPMTYLTFGAGKAAGVGGRTMAAERLAAAGLDEAATRVGRLGVMGASKAEREVVFAGMKNAENLATPGFRFSVPFVGEARIPGTERLAEVVGTGLSKGRAAVGDTRVGQIARNARAPRGLEAAARTLARGEQGTNDALGLIARERTSSAASKGFVERHVRDADRLARQSRKSGEAADRAAFTALDEGLLLEGNALTGREFLDRVHGEAAEKLPTLGKRQDYAPHIFSDEARKAMRGDSFAAMRQAVGVDVTDATGGAVKRTIHPGTKLTMPDGSVVEFVADTAHGAVSARQINEKLGAALGVKKVIEDRLSHVLQPYVEGIAESVGRAEGLRRLTQIADIGGLEEAVDAVATKAAGAKQAKGVEKATKSNVNDMGKVAGELAKGGTQAKKQLVAQLERQLKEVEAMLPEAQRLEQMATNARKGLGTERDRVTKAAVSDVSAAQPRLDALAKEQSDLFAGATVEREAIEASRRQAQDEGTDAAAKEATGALDAQVAKVEADIQRRRDSVLGDMSEVERKAVKAYDQLDAAQSVAAGRRMEAKDLQATIKRDIEIARKNLAAAKRLKTDPKSLAAYGKVGQELDDMLKLVGNFDGADDVKALLSWHATGVSELRDGKLLNDGLVSLGKAVKSGEIVPVMKQVIRDGYEQIGKNLLGDEAPMVRKELARQLENLDKVIETPAFLKMIDKYTQFFKTYATATVGFHVRNGMTAAFMNASDGVAVRNMERGARLWQQFDRAPREFTKNLPDWITPEQADDALRAVFASGGGGGQYGAAELRLGKGKMTNNMVTRLSQRAGSKVEGFARMGMALDSVLAGETWEAAAARITRVHFDYSQVSKLDANMKRIIPFWTFMSRNVPLQLQQMFMKPRMYQAYKSFARNMGQGDDDSMIPQSWREAGAFQITDGVWAAPDLSHLRVGADLEKLLSDPQRLLADANPVFKVPFETLIAKRKLYSDTPFKENGFESVSGGGLSVLLPVLSVLGLTETAGDGTQVLDERLSYALRGLLPPLAQAQRLTGDDPYYKDKQGQSIANNLGLPIKLLTPGQVEAERKRRERESVASSKGDARKKALEAWKN